MKVANIAVCLALVSGVNVQAAELVTLGKAEFNSSIVIKKECSMTLIDANGDIYIPTYNELDNLKLGQINFKSNAPATIQIASATAFTDSAPWGSPTIGPEIQMFFKAPDDSEKEIKGPRTDIELTPSKDGATYQFYPLVKAIPSHSGTGSIKTTLTVNCNVL